MIHSCIYCGHEFEGVPTEEEDQAHLQVCPGPPTPEGCVCANRVGLARALPCGACAAAAQAREAAARGAAAVPGQEFSG